MPRTINKQQLRSELKQKLSPNKAQTGFISYEYVTVKLRFGSWLNISQSGIYGQKKVHN